MIVNKLKWVSGTSSSEDELKQLNERMAHFYSQMSSRLSYQNLNDYTHAAEGDPVHQLTGLVADRIVQMNFSNVLEIGCGSGKIYETLVSKGFTGKYTGIEMAPAVIENNRIKYPQADWEAASVYDYCIGKTGFDCCFAFFVLEHLIYPEKGLNAMMNTLKPGGHLILVFPDFSSSGILPSQKVGITYGKGAKIKFKEGRIADAIISFYEARFIARQLRHVNKKYGSFVINTNPYCLSEKYESVIPDADAVYISNKSEIKEWAASHGHDVYFPNGTEGLFASAVFVGIKKLCS